MGDDLEGARRRFAELAHRRRKRPEVQSEKVAPLIAPEGVATPKAWEKLRRSLAGLAEARAKRR
jgi:hypothetical protein